MDIKDIIELDRNYYTNSFGNRTPLCFTHGKGIKLTDTEGKQYYDLYGGIAVSSLGHGHPALVKAISSQASKLIHCSNIYYVESQSLLAKTLVLNSCAKRVFFGNSGAEANEGAIKLARLYFYKNNMPEKYEIITLRNSFHGRTLATLAATGQDKFHKGYHPLTPSFVHVQPNDITALNNAVNERTCAVMMELIQGECGVFPMDIAYVKAVRKLCDEKNILLIFDEVQTGVGRTGKLFAYQKYGVEPDIFTLAKGLAGGVPIGAVCACEKTAETIQPGDHGSTFGGNPLACSAATAVLSTILQKDFLNKVESTGDYFKKKLTSLAKTSPLITEIRGSGLMLAIQFNSAKLPLGFAVKVRDALMLKQFLVGNVGDHIIRVLPPLIIKKSEIDLFIKAFSEVLNEISINA